MKMRKNISTIQLIMTLIIGGLNTYMFFHWFFQLKNKRFLFMTWWNFYINSIFFIVVLFCDIYFYFSKNKKYEKLNYIFRNDYASVSTTLSIFVTIIFWGLIFKSLNPFNKSYDQNKIYRSIYVHLIITILLIIDLLTSEREENKFNFTHLNIDFIILGIYMILTIILIYIYDKPIYPFLKKIDFTLLLCYGILFVITMIISYYLYLGLIFIKYKYNIGLEKENNNLEEPLIIDKED